MADISAREMFFLFQWSVIPTGVAALVFALFFTLGTIIRLCHRRRTVLARVPSAGLREA